MTTCRRTFAGVERALCLAPFEHLAATANTRCCVTFLRQPLPDQLKLPFVSPNNDFELLRATPGEVFSVLRLIDGRPSNPAAFIERTCKVKTTTRFFDTTIKLLQAAMRG